MVCKLYLKKLLKLIGRKKEDRMTNYEVPTAELKLFSARVWIV